MFLGKREVEEVKSLLKRSIKGKLFVGKKECRKREGEGQVLAVLVLFYEKEGRSNNQTLRQAAGKTFEDNNKPRDGSQRYKSGCYSLILSYLSHDLIIRTADLFGCAY